MPAKAGTTKGSQARAVQWVVVLGDFGRSPRMQYHAASLARQPETEVHVVAYGGSSPLDELQQARNVHIKTLPEPPRALKKLPRLLQLAFKVLHQLFWLLWTVLGQLPRPRNILLQTPPAIPTMAICWLAARWHRATLVIDWHNYGYTIMALTYGPQHPLVRLARAWERSWGRARGARHFCVTAAMQQDLRAKWGIEAAVLYDRPPARFRRTEVADVHALFRRLGTSLEQPRHHDFLTAAARGSSEHANGGRAQAGPEVTAMTTNGLGSFYLAFDPLGGQAAGPQLRPDRPAVVVSSTSWTPDEDFGVLLDAAVEYDRLAAAPGSGLPNLLLLITGRGPQRDMYLERVAGLTFRHVAVRSLWLEAADYPLLLGAADVGVSLHASSSGLDLPMKIVDMFGSGLPVCALAYGCISELVADGETGLLFSDAQQLGTQLAQLLAGFPGRPSELLVGLAERVRSREQALRWDENWDRVAGPVLGY